MAAANVTELNSVEDILEAGALEEESGERWHGLDFAKSLRFFQKAIDYYHAAIEFGVEHQDPDLPHAYYNAARLTLYVYTHFQKADGVDLKTVSSTSEVLAKGDKSVLQPIGAILQAHEALLLFLGQDSPLDLIFNAAMVYTDFIDELDNDEEILQYASKAAELLGRVFLRQEESLKSGREENTDSLLKLLDLCETMVAFYNLVQVTYENLNWTSASLKAAQDAFLDQLMLIENAWLVLSLNPAPQLSSEDAAELQIARCYAQSLSLPDLDASYAIWDSSELPESAERYMLAADCTETHLEKARINFAPGNNPEVYWTALTKMNLYFKSAQDKLNETLQSKKTSSEQIGLGGLISQIAKVYIARADIDLQRSLLPLEQAQKHNTVLLNNAKAFLKNGMNLAKQSGGIREMALEKMQRETRRLEAISRMCVLENKTSVAELNSIMGEGRWEREMQQLRELWYYSGV